MTADVARRAAERVVGARADGVRLVSSGQSSDAWLVDVADGKWITRVPIDDSGRRITYRAEQLIGDYLTSFGHPVAAWTTIEIDGFDCSVARELSGTTVDAGQRWAPAFGEQLAAVLQDLHEMPARGYGPLADDGTTARGVSSSLDQGIVDRWYHAAIWPFDGSSLADHPIADAEPHLGESVASMRRRIERAATAGSIGVVHSDLHRAHLLEAADGTLAGVLDFGDAFIGAVAWDFALLQWYYGDENVELVAAHSRRGEAERARGALLAVAVGLYKLAKNPTDQAVLPRLRRCVRAARHA